MVFHEATSKFVDLFPQKPMLQKNASSQLAVLVSAMWKGDGQANGAINIMLMNSRTDLSSEECDKQSKVTEHLNKNSFCITPQKEV